MDNRSTAARREHCRHRRRRAVAASAAVVAAAGTALIPASSASADIIRGIVWQNQPTGLCMDVAGGYALNFAMVRTWSCNYTSAQVWAYDTADNTMRFDADQRFCLAVWQDDTTEGSAVDLQWCDGSQTQEWTFDSYSNSTLVNVASGLCLNVPGEDPNPGRELWLWDCNPNPMQTWTGWAVDG